MRTKTRALTALALLAALALVAAALLERRSAPSEAAPDLSPASDDERQPTPPPVSAVPVQTETREVAAPDLSRADAGGDNAKVSEKVSGRVADGSGAPIAGADVGVAPFERIGERLGDPLGQVGVGFGAQGGETAGASHVTVTGADGRFELALPAAERVRLVVRARGFAPLEQTLRPGARGSHGAPLAGIALGDLTLQPGGVLVGIVRTRAGAPVADAVVRRLDPVNRAAAVAHAGLGVVLARTDAAGGFRVAELDAGPWRLLVSAAAHPEAVFEGAAPGTVDSPLEREFVLDDGARITGRVLGTAAEREGLEVRAQPGTPGAVPRTAQFDDSGAFQLDGLTPEARYRVGAWRRGDDPSARPRSDAVVVTSGATGVGLRLVPTTTIEFRAVDSSTGAPVTEFEAHLVLDGNTSMLPSATLAGPTGRPVYTFPGGVAVFPVLRPDAARTYTLVVWGRHHAPLEVSGIVCTPGARLALGDVALQAASGLEVTVLGAGDSAPVEGAFVSLSVVRMDETAVLRAVLEVSLAPPWRRTRTDANGRALVSGRPVAHATLVVQHSSFKVFRAVSIADVEVSAGRAEVRLEAR